MVSRLLQAGGQTLSMSDWFELTAGDHSRATIAARGAALVGLTLSDVELIPECKSAQAMAYFAGSTLAPWPNRMAAGSWRHGVELLQHPANDGAGNANHGLVFDREFRVVAQSASELKLSYEITKREAAVYPFDVRVEVAYAINADGLRVELCAVNNGSEPAPIALGSHPYFAAPAGTTLNIGARQAGLDAQDMIPSRRGSVAELGLAPGRPQSVEDLHLDHEFSELGSPAVTVLTLPDGTRALIEQDDALPYQMVFVARNFPWDAGAATAVAIEPQSAAIDAFNNGLGLQNLLPGERWAASWGVRLER